MPSLCCLGSRMYLLMFLFFKIDWGKKKQSRNETRIEWQEPKNLFFDNKIPYQFLNACKLIYEHSNYQLKPFVNFENISRVVNIPQRQKIEMIVFGYFVFWRMHLMMFPIYSLIFYSIDIYNDSIITDGSNTIVSNVNALQALIMIGLFFSVILYCVTFGLVLFLLLPMYYKLSFILPSNRLIKQNESDTEQDDFYQVMKLLQLARVGDAQRIFCEIMCQCHALELRPAKAKVVIQYYGKDIGRIVLMYLPVYDHEKIVLVT